MSFEKALREMVRRELDSQLRPLQQSMTRLGRSLDTVAELRSMAERMAPLVSRGGARGAPAFAPARSAAAPARAPTVSKAKAAPAASSSERACAVIGCKRPSRSKGYCSAHYQKLRLLIRTGRRPADWKDDAAPQSARDLKLPRGRAAARERTPEPPAPREPPKPKAWVRKKGSATRVSL